MNLVSKVIAAINARVCPGLNQAFEEIFSRVLQTGITTALQGSAPYGLERAMKDIKDKAARPGNQHL